MVPLRRPGKNAPLRWHKKLGEPTCIIEVLLQHTWLLVPYTAIIVTLILAVQLTGWKF